MNKLVLEKNEISNWKELSPMPDEQSTTSCGRKIKKTTVANSWFLCKQDAISNKTPLTIEMDRLKFKLEIFEALSASPPTYKSIFTHDEDNSVAIPLAKRLKRNNPPAIHIMAFILAIPG
ncbi:uncharacterized protein TNCV_380601 [Trichonephila clavipes]|nr:uncharacterized protein TNCV_380601 [Trichonephila clavipes]